MMVKVSLGVVCMNWKYVVCSVLVVVGVMLFLYGVNTYDTMVGWSGIGIGIGGLAAYVVFKVFESVRKSEV